MKILNTFKFKIGSGGKRNRANRRRDQRRQAYHVALGHKGFEQPSQHSSLPDDLCNEDFGLVGTKPGLLDVKAIHAAITKPIEPKLDLTGKWDETLARKALALFEASGKSGRAFAAEHGISDSKLRSWAKKLSETSAA
jgi:hypothetical protein